MIIVRHPRTRRISLAHLLAVLSATGVQALDQIGGVAEEEGVARRTRDHGQHRQPHVRQRLRRKSARRRSTPDMSSECAYKRLKLRAYSPAVTDAEHVRHGFEQRPRVLFQPVGFLYDRVEHMII